MKRNRKEYARTYRAAHKEKQREYMKNYFVANRTKFNEEGKKYRVRNLEKERERGRKYHSAHSEQIGARKRQNRLSNLASHLVRAAQRRAQKNGLEFDITADDVKIPLTCPLLGYVLVCSTKAIAPNSPTLDRKDPRKGYVRGNVWVISSRANVAKNDLTLEELQMLVMNLAVHTNTELGC